jgi:uncharacterized protein with ParB-like and HNH nuclease domain
MSFQTPITIKEVVDNITTNNYVLPAIQREFVWSEKQIVKLFDSLMRGYPIGSFLFWEIEEENKGDYKFYSFLRNFHERDNSHNEKINLTGQPGNVTAILDGQQRFNSLYIGLKGSYATKLKHYQWSSDYAFPDKELYINILSKSDDYDLEYDFQFMKEQEIKKEKENEYSYWFKVEEILNFDDASDTFHYLSENGIMEHKAETHTLAYNILDNLYRTIYEKKYINFFLEKEQDIEKVLDIFIRVNRGGTQLSYPDLLLSIATSQWEEKDAREVIYSFVEEINRIGSGFDFKKRFVLKAALVLADIDDVSFKVENFNHDNMIKIEREWNKISKAIRMTIKLISKFGFQRKTLTSSNAIIPIAYYLLKKDFPNGFIDSSRYNQDRKIINQWLNIVLLKRTFSNGPDNVLKNVREALNESSLEEFPVDEIITKLNRIGRVLRFEEEEIEGLLDNPYNGSYTFSILSILYPTLDFNNKFHQDHIYPRSLFKKTNLKERNYDVSKYEEYREKYNLLGNIQLLEGKQNQEKNNKEFDQWLADNFDNKEEIRRYKERHYIPDVDLSFDNFLEFFEKREKLIVEKLKEEFRGFINR